MILAGETSAGSSYEVCCQSLVKPKDLPLAYLITATRLKAAMELPTVAQQDKLVGHANASLKEELAEEGKTPRPKL